MSSLQRARSWEVLALVTASACGATDALDAGGGMDAGMDAGVDAAGRDAGRCEGVRCPECPPAITVELEFVGVEPRLPTVEGASLDCERSDPLVRCTQQRATPGEHAVTLDVPGFGARTVRFTLLAEDAPCCICSVRRPYYERLLFVADGGVAGDGGPMACEAEDYDHVREGGFCDVIEVCAEDGERAAQIEAASGNFTCDSAGVGLCSTPWSCTYYRDDGSGPGTIDAEVLEDLCPVARLSPDPNIRCIVWL